MDAVRHETGQICFADRLAACQGSASEHHVRPTLAAAFHLTPQAFEEGGGANDGVGHLLVRLQRGFEGQLRLLKFQQWFLHADG